MQRVRRGRHNPSCPKIQRTRFFIPESHSALCDNQLHICRGLALTISPAIPVFNYGHHKVSIVHIASSLYISNVTRRDATGVWCDGGRAIRFLAHPAHLLRLHLHDGICWPRRGANTSFPGYTNFFYQICRLCFQQLYCRVGVLCTDLFAECFTSCEMHLAC
jgi:hypothetical protein